MMLASRMPVPESYSRFLVRLAAIFCCLCLPLTCSMASNRPSLDQIPPRPIREFRGAWVATVVNLDWPSKPGLSTAQQKAELVAIMDRAAHLKLNALILQVRPACDAFYASKFEPWSEFLTGQMGKAPEPFYDPLAFAVEEAHRRGLELHAWFNPFRVRAPNPKSGPSANYISQTQPQWVRRYGSQLWLDPGLKEVQDHSAQVILDVVRRYDIDGVHLDDYFYPYPEKESDGKLLDFPDTTAWQRYAAAGGKLSRGDWRRKNVDDFVQSLSTRIKAEKKWVKFGISTFGIWRPGHPKQIKGLDAFEHLHADARKWFANGWLDYLSPQLYWEVAKPEQSYPVLLEWWASQNASSRHLWPGNNATRVGAQWSSSEIIQQIRLTRTQPGATGNIIYNMTSLMRNNGALAEAMARDLYAQPALIPPSPWLDDKPPAKPKMKLQHCPDSRKWEVRWTNTSDEKVWLWYYQARIKGQWTASVFPGAQSVHQLPALTSRSYPDTVALTAVDRCGNLSPTALFVIRPAN
jgi:uncharacterized lipoprotein YddW (UPF0748 family)